MKDSPKFNIFWFRRDLRLEDNKGLYEALISKYPVLPIFIFDTLILNKLESNRDARVQFILDSLLSLNDQLRQIHAGITIYYGEPLQIFQEIVKNFEINAVYTNEDFEPYGIDRDQKVLSFLSIKNISFFTYYDHVLFRPGTIVKPDNSPYTVYTPFMRKWRQTLLQHPEIDEYPSQSYLSNLVKNQKSSITTLNQIGFLPTEKFFPTIHADREVLKNYQATRDFPFLQRGTSKLGIHLRFGTISIRKLVKEVMEFETYLNELIWREFFIQILYHFPRVVDESFRKAYDQIEWENKEADFEAWCEGKTGFPMVDAGMRELNSTGYMHNRVRMVVASFLCKHLLIDWRWGEAYFASKLLDYELASNNGNWQWAAGTGCDAAPYFRIFNPMEQQRKFDPEMIYIKKWIPEFGTENYPKPIVDHSFARERALARYAKALK